MGAKCVLNWGQSRSKDVTLTSILEKNRPKKKYFVLNYSILNKGGNIRNCDILDIWRNFTALWFYKWGVEICLFIIFPS